MGEVIAFRRKRLSGFLPADLGRKPVVYTPAPFPEPVIWCAIAALALVYFLVDLSVPSPRR